MSRELNCPNCGAPLGTQDVCEYCGTHFIDYTMDAEEPFYIKIRHNGMVRIDKVRMIRAGIEQDTPTINYADDIKGIYGIKYGPPEVTYRIELMSLGVPHEEIDKFRKEKA